jgi:hypothetical protein
VHVPLRVRRSTHERDNVVEQPCLPDRLPEPDREVRAYDMHVEAVCASPRQRALWLGRTHEQYDGG